MSQTLHAVALRTVKYNDRNSILTAWTAERGLVSMLMPAGRSRESLRRRALTQPLSLFECVADLHPGRELCRVSDLRAIHAFGSIHSAGMKSAVAFFIAEVLAKALRGGGDPAMWQFIVDSLCEFDAMDSRHAANFHLWFMVHLAAMLGFGPDSSEAAYGRIFDYRAGTFTATPPISGPYAAGNDARLARILIDSSAARLAMLRLNHSSRAAILDAILDYYAAQQLPLAPLRTLAVVCTL